MQQCAWRVRLAFVALFGVWQEEEEEEEDGEVRVG